MSQKIARRKIADYIAKELLAGTASKELAQQVAAYLIDTKQTAAVELMIRDIEGALAAHGSVVISIETAHQLDDASRTLLKNFIKDVEQAQHVVITHESVDPELLGGVLIRSSQRVFDGTVRGKLQHLIASTKAS